MTNETIELRTTEEGFAWFAEWTGDIFLGKYRWDHTTLAEWANCAVRIYPAGEPCES